MSSLYFADQKAQNKKQNQHDEEEERSGEQDVEEAAHVPAPAPAPVSAPVSAPAPAPAPAPTRVSGPVPPSAASRANSFASSAIAPMSVVGNDGIVETNDAVDRQDYQPGGKVAETNGIVDAQVQAVNGNGHFVTMTGQVASTANNHPDAAANMPPAAEEQAAANSNTTATATAINNNNNNSSSSSSNSTSKKNCNNIGDGKQDDRRGKMICWGLLCCLLVAGGVGAGVGIPLSRQNNNEAASAPTPSLPPADTNATSKPQPTEKPKPTEKPSTPPPVLPPSSVIIEQPPSPLNDQCSQATVVSTEGIIFGSTLAAALVTEDFLDCGMLETDGPGVWYQVVGQGSLLTASTCGGDTTFDTKLSILTGSSCDSLLQCVADNDDAPCDNSGTKSSVTWLTQAGITYYILVRGHNGARGELVLSLSPEAATNDDCEGAITVQPNGGFTGGSTVAATLDFVGICDELDTTSPGVWYKVAGTGETIILSTCHKTYFDTKLTIFQGSCGRLTCVEANDDGCGRQSRVELETQGGVTYYVLVHGYETVTGSFHLHVANKDNLYNNFCQDARRVPIGTYVQGNNIYADFDFEAATKCDKDIVISGPTVWFSVIGTGGDISASLCDAETNFDTQMSVFSGSCSALVCLGGNDDAADATCGFTSEQTWKSEPFETYLIAVHGYQNVTGNFGFFAEDLGGTPIFDTCVGAGGSVPLGNVVPVSLANDAVIDSSVLDCGAPSGSITTVQGVWLYTVGDGGNLTASVCENNPDGSKIMVLQGDCSSLACANNVADSCTITWASEPLGQYYLFVQGAGSGNYELSLTTTGPPYAINDECTGATPLEIDTGVPVSGNTILANVDQVPNQLCGEEVTSPGAWYSVIGTGNNVTVGLCFDETDFDTKISVFEGDCGSLVCVGGNDDSCGLQSAYEWASQLGVTYYVLVHGFADNVGNFGIIAVTQ